jgi:beta-glucosidase/6-phospho-beta-glucosidase/beta-galactosidase
MIAHNAILAHAKTVQLYRQKYQSSQQGTIGIVLNTAHFYPKDENNLDDVAAAQRAYGLHSTLHTSSLPPPHSP